MFFLALLLLAAAAVWFASLWRTERVGGLVISPLLVFGSLFAIFVVPAAVASTLPSQTTNAVPLVLVGFAALAFLAGFTHLRRNQRFLGRFGTGAVLFPENRTTADAYSAQYLRATALTTVVLTILGFYWLQGLPPLFTNIRDILGGSVDADTLYSSSLDFRLQTTKIAWFGGEDRGQGFLGPIMRYGWPFLFLVALFLLKNTRRGTTLRNRWLGLTIIIGIVGFAFVGGNFTRHPLLGGILTILIGLSFLRPINLRTASIFGGLAVFVFVGLSITSHKAVNVIDDTSALAQKLTNRVFFANGANDIATIELLNDGILDYRWGNEHLRQGLSALPGVKVGSPFAYELYTTLNPGSDRLVNLTGTYYSQLYLDFSEIGVILGFYLLGLGVAWSYQPLFGVARPPEQVAVVATMTFLLGHMVFSGPVGLVSSTVALFATYFLLRWSLKVVGRPGTAQRVSGRRQYEPPLLRR